MQLPDSPYVGRFAPSPTGPLHLGSLYTALASFLDARHHGGQWLLRIDDLDTPRNVPGAADAILRCLEAFHLHWDGAVYYQSLHQADYREILDELFRQDLAYVCTCSRKQLADNPIYPGHCRKLGLPISTPGALRIRTDERQIQFDDILQGRISENLQLEHGDFVIRRRDDIVAYQFAVVIDDWRQGVNQVVRGVDLLTSTPKQIYLHQLLDYPEPCYQHLPVIVDSQGQKLSKQTLAAPVDSSKPRDCVWHLLSLLGLHPPADLANADLDSMLVWGASHWRLDALTTLKAIQLAG